MIYKIKNIINSYFSFSLSVLLSDKILLLSVFVLSITGIFTIYSATHTLTLNNPNIFPLYQKQIIFIFIGFLFFTIFSMINYRKMAEHSVWIFIISIILLLLPLFFGKPVNNASRWVSLGFINFQPSELVKIFFVIIIAKYFENYRYRMHQIKYIFLLFLIAFLPIFLIFIEPDLGTAMVLVLILITLLFVGGFNLKYFLSMFFIGVFTIAIPINYSYNRINQNVSIFSDLLINTDYLLLIIFAFSFISVLFYAFYFLLKKSIIFYTLSYSSMITAIGLISGIITNKYILKEYQKERLLSFINPLYNKYDIGYNAIQSQVTIGSGKVFGKGFLQGTQGQLGFLPSHTTDFIFSNIGEEFGFLGSSFVLFFYIIFIYRLLTITANAKDYLGGLVVIGITTLFCFQIVINLAMNLGLAPITGLPLPFITYGGTSFITAMIAVGIVFNINSKKYINQSS